jgi:putative membrane protein
MQRTHPRIARASLAVASLVLAWACGGDANKQSAATPDSAASATTSAAAGDVNAGGGGVNPTEAVAFMAAADSAEIKAAQIATKKATNAQVRQFAQEMIRDHGKAAKEDAALAKKMNVDLKTAGNQGQMASNVQSMAQQTAQQLNSTPKGAAFDKAYIDSQVQGHQTVLENLQRIAGTSGGGTTGTTGTSTGAQPTTAATGTQAGAPATPQESAQKMIPLVQQHLEKARQIQSKLGNAR